MVSTLVRSPTSSKSMQARLYGFGNSHRTTSATRIGYAASLARFDVRPMVRQPTNVGVPATCMPYAPASPEYFTIRAITSQPLQSSTGPLHRASMHRGLAPPDLAVRKVFRRKSVRPSFARLRRCWNSCNDASITCSRESTRSPERNAVPAPEVESLSCGRYGRFTSTPTAVGSAARNHSTSVRAIPGGV